MDSTVLFESIIYRKELPEYVDNLNKITNDYLHMARKEAKDSIYEREKRYGVRIGDHGMSYHSGAEMYKDERFSNFELLIRNTSRNILQDQGFDLSNYFINSDPLFVNCFIDRKQTVNPRGKQYKDPGGYGVVRIKYYGG